MGRKRSTGLRNRGGIWHIEKQILGKRVCESTGTSDLEEAELILARRIEGIRKAKMFGVRPTRKFREAATRFLEENLHLDSIACYAEHFRQLDPFIGDMALDQVHSGSLQAFVNAKRAKGNKSKSINLALSAVRRVLNLAARLWRDEQGMTWLEAAPLIQMLPVTDARQPYPLDWDEQQELFAALPGHLAQAALFQVNTGLREQEVCQLRWDWEIPIPSMDTSVFLIPAGLVKNDEDRLVILNRMARGVIDEQRGKHDTRVFAFRGKGIGGIYNGGWRRARVRAALSLIQRDPRCKTLDECVERSRRDIVVTISNRVAWEDEPVIVRYTLAEHEADRKQRGQPPLKPYQWRDPDTATQILYKARLRLIDSTWPAYSQLARVRNHDLKHTFGRRLRAAGVPLETRKVLLGHKNGDITSHYSAVEIEELISAVEKVCEQESGKTPALIVLKRKAAIGVGR